MRKVVVIEGSDGEDFDGYKYELPAVPPKSDILFSDLEATEQYWRRPLLPTETEINFMSEAEKSVIRSTELRRRVHGVWFMNNGEPTYITGDHYFFLTHWWMNADTADGYPEYRNAHKWLFYFYDYVDKSPDALGAIFITQKRSAKTEGALSCIYNCATNGIVTDSIFGMQSLNEKEAKENLFWRVIRSHNRLHTLLKAADDGNKNSKQAALSFKPPSLRSGKVSVKKSYLMNEIGYRATIESAYQGKRPKKILLDEPPTIEQMDVGLWWRTVKQQLSLGKKVIGKALLPATVETMTAKGAPAYEKLWHDSNPAELDNNGRTRSGLLRYFQPYWMAFEGFIDKYGNCNREEVEKWMEGQVENADDDGKIQLRRQYPPSIDHVFEVPAGTTLESDVVDILTKHLKDLRDNPIPMRHVKLFMDSDGNVQETQFIPKSKEDRYKYVRITEDPRPGVKYVIGIDGTGTDKETSNNSAKKSKFAITVTKLFEGLMCRNYCDVATYCIIPDRVDDAYKMAYMLYLKYNKYDECRVIPEGNQGQAPAILSYFENKGAKKAISKQPKYPGTNNVTVQNRRGFYRSAEVMDWQVKRLNTAARAYGTNFGDDLLIEDLLLTGLKNTDLSDSFQACLLLWGDFAPERVEKINVRHSTLGRRRLVTQNGITKYIWTAT